MFSISKAHAIVIGVGDYDHPGFKSLPATTRDAQAIAATLIDSTCCGYQPKNVQIITGENATVKGIRTALQSLAQSTDSQSIVFIYFSGHGGQMIKDSSLQTYLCPREADPDNLPNTAITGDEFSNLLDVIPASKVFVIIDACHAAGSAELKAANGTAVWKSGLTSDYYQALSRGSGRVILSSSKETQFSYIRSQGDFSTFTWHLLRGLEGEASVYNDGFVRVLDLYYYVSQQVKSNQSDQEPVLHAKDIDDNFPVAIVKTDPKGKRNRISDNLRSIREKIVRDPITGAKALSEYLAKNPEWAPNRNKVDLQRSELERIQEDINIFGLSTNTLVDKRRVVYHLLRICMESEQYE